MLALAPVAFSGSAQASNDAAAAYIEQLDAYHAAHCPRDKTYAMADEYGVIRSPYMDAVYDYEPKPGSSISRFLANLQALTEADAGPLRNSLANASAKPIPNLLQVIELPIHRCEQGELQLATGKSLRLLESIGILEEDFPNASLMVTVDHAVQAAMEKPYLSTTTYHALIAPFAAIASRTPAPAIQSPSHSTTPEPYDGGYNLLPTDPPVKR